MNEDVIGLYWSPWEQWNPQGSSGPGLLGRVHQHFAATSRPRDEAYMKALFHETYPQGEFVAVEPDLTGVDRIGSAKTIVLLYPDPIGLGFGKLERLVHRAKAPWASVRVLNGRRRHFLLNASTGRAMSLRRGAKVLLVGELVIVLLCAVLTPLLIVVDLARGRT